MSAQHYTGGCQCGAVRYEVTVDLDNTIVCNCSRCGRLGSILAFAPQEQFTLLSGEERLTDFQFNKNVIHHLFCDVCGIQSFARGTTPNGKAMVAVNARCLDGVEPDDLRPNKVDGRSR
ncbi:MAG TPA: GFA family protein [Alphaproteobacteria bacterium]|nr:GFA family protein [Alphaproteobacteria bacterium]